MCKYCSKRGGDKNEKHTMIAEGAWSIIDMVVDNVGRVYLQGESDERTDRVYINFCPFCGRKI
jgi:hypothetical protein